MQPELCSHFVRLATGCLQASSIICLSALLLRSLRIAILSDCSQDICKPVQTVASDALLSRSSRPAAFMSEQSQAICRSVAIVASVPCCHAA